MLFSCSRWHPFVFLYLDGKKLFSLALTALFSQKAVPSKCFKCWAHFSPLLSDAGKLVSSSTQANSPASTTLLASGFGFISGQKKTKPNQKSLDSLDKYPVMFCALLLIAHLCGSWDLSSAGREIVATCFSKSWVWRMDGMEPHKEQTVMGW